MRFERSSLVTGGKLFSRNEVNPRLRYEQSLDRATFLGLLWAHFGPATPRDGGFEYHVRDRESGIAFTAFCGPNGPSYGGELSRRFALRPVLEAFERMLDATQPVNCSIVYAAEIEYGGGLRVLGWREGRAFDIPDRRAQRYALKDRRARG
jgi:hypothetical protein